MPGQTLSEKVKLLVEWAPALSLLSAIANAKPGKDQVLEVVRLLEFLARKTDITLDDEAVRLTQDILLTPQGAALVDYVSRLITGMVEQAKYESLGPDRS